MPHIVGLAEVSESDLPLVGGKASKLGELVRRGLPIPPGFVVTTELYQNFVDSTKLRSEIPEISAACHHVMRLPTARKITSCTLIARSTVALG